MNEETRKEIISWLIKSRHDLGSAERLMEGDTPYLDTAVYHCQQAAEKAVKAYLRYHAIPFEKTHNLVSLVSLCFSLEPGFEQWKDTAAVLTPYATEFRYPGDVLEPTPEEANRALTQARAFVRFIMDHLPENLSP